MSNIVHPDHYNWLPGVECMDVVKHFDFCLGNAIKYIWRAGHKDSSTFEEDIHKAIYYLNVSLETYQEKQCLKNLSQSS